MAFGECDDTDVRKKKHPVYRYFFDEAILSSGIINAFYYGAALNVSSREAFSKTN